MGRCSHAGARYVQVLIPVGTNFLFGPSILAFWYQKKGRVLILIANLNAAAVIWRTLDDGDNGLKWWWAIPILWVWALALCARARETSNSQAGFYLLLIAHLCVIAFVYEHRKSPDKLWWSKRYSLTSSFRPRLMNILKPLCPNLTFTNSLPSSLCAFHASS